MTRAVITNSAATDKKLFNITGSQVKTLVGSTVLTQLLVVLFDTMTGGGGAIHLEHYNFGVAGLVSFRSIASGNLAVTYFTFKNGKSCQS